MRGLKAASFIRKHRVTAGLQDLRLWCACSASGWALNMPAVVMGAVKKKICLCFGGAGLCDTEQMDFLYSV